MKTPAKPLVTTELGEVKIDFLIDTGATYSVLNTNNGKLRKETVNVVGATGKAEKQTFFNPIIFKFGERWITHQFLYMHECPVTLLGRDLLSKLEAQIVFKDGEM